MARTKRSRAAPKTETKAEPRVAATAEKDTGPTGRPGAARTDVPPDKEEKREPAKRTTKAKAGAWLGASNLRPRIGQTVNLSWRANEPVKLWAVGGGGTRSFEVGQRGSLPLLPTVAGDYVYTLRADDDGEELARLELTVRA